MTFQMRLGKKLKQKETHGKSNGKSLSSKFREVQSTVAKNVELKKDTQNFSFSKKCHSVQRQPPQFGSSKYLSTS